MRSLMRNVDNSACGEPLAVAFTRPGADGYFDANFEAELETNASAAELYLDGHRIGEADGQPFVFEVGAAELPEGQYQLDAVATLEGEIGGARLSRRLGMD